MQPIIYKINLDLHESNSQYILKLSRGDVGGEIRATFNEAGKTYSLENCTCKFSALKGDGNYIYNDCTVNTESNYVSYIITDQTSAACGVTKCQLIVIGNDGKIKAAPKFELVIDDKVYDEQEIIDSTSEFNTITSLQASVNENTSNISTNASNISALQTSVSNNSTGISSLQSSVSANTSNISTLQSSVETNSSDINSLKSRISTDENNISTLQSDVSTNSSDISSLQLAVSDLDEDKASYSEVYTWDEVDDLFLKKTAYQWGTGLKANTNIYGTTTIAVDFNPTSEFNTIRTLQAGVEANKANISTLQTEVEAKQDTLIAGTNISISNNTISATDTTYDNATTSSAGLMSSTDKSKLDGISSGAEVNVQANWNESDSTSDSYIKNKPTIPDTTNMEVNTNKVTSISSASTNIQYPSAKAVYDYIQSLNGNEVGY